MNTADLALIEQVRRLQKPIVHFYQHASPCVSIGRFETRCHALREEFCTQQAISVVRRITGGGAVYLDAQQLCLTLVAPLAHLNPSFHSLSQCMQQFNAALAQALRTFGVTASAKFPNSVEIKQRQVAQGMLARLEDVVFYQAFIWLDIDMEATLKALQTPKEKLTPQGMQSAREHFVTLRELLPVPLALPVLESAITCALGKTLTDAMIIQGANTCGDTVSFDSLDLDMDASLDEPWPAQRDQTWQACLPTPGGILYLRLQLDTHMQHILQANFATTMQLAPLGWLQQLGQALAGVNIEMAIDAARIYIRTHPYDSIGLHEDDLMYLLKRALHRGQEQDLGLQTRQANALMVVAPLERDTQSILEQCSVVLVPYCAKPSHCTWRHVDECGQCGACEVGEVYRMAAAKNLRVITITHYEHLCATLETLAAEGTKAYFGMCCAHFYLKRFHAFHTSKIPAVLTDISGANCYQLNQEELAYKGAFKAKASLDIKLVTQLLHHMRHHAEKLDEH